MKPARLVSILFLCIGALLLAIGAFLVLHTRSFLARAVSAPGMVIENVWKESRSADDEDTGAYYPRVRFRTASGEPREFVSSTGSSPAAYDSNEAVTVLYEPGNPAEATISGFWQVWLGVVILLGLGAIFFSIGVVTRVITAQ
jgi:hypothetical protein